MMAKLSTHEQVLPFVYGVVIPAFNAEATIEAAVKSVLGQRLSANEVVVVDDGSIDRTASIIESIKSPLIRLIRQTNLGPGSARNRGIEAARSHWIAFLDADDLWTSDHALSLRALSMAFPQAGLLAATHREVRQVENVDDIRAGSGNERLIDFFRANGLSPFQTSAVAIRRQLVGQLGGFPNQFPGEDVDLWLRAALVTPIAMTSRITAYYIRRPNSAMSHVSDNIATFLGLPILQSIEGALADRACVSAHGGLLHYREKIYRLFLRQAVARSETTKARQILSLMLSKQISAPLYLRLLSSMPCRWLRLANSVRQTVTSFRL
jgi:glycosyltransferase involved in cell wall biosynthesis